MPIESARFQKMFGKFNSKHFDGRLPEYTIRVVYDVDFWVGNPYPDGTDGYFVPDELRIFLRQSYDRRRMIRTLIHEMVHVRVGPGHGEHFINEMKRLKAKGVPIEKWYPPAW